MKVTTSIDEAAHIRVHTLTGKVLPEDLKKILRELYGSPGFDRRMNSLWDLSEADVSAFSAEDVRQVMALVKSNWGAEGESRSAIVGSKDLIYGLSRMYQTMMESASRSAVMVFRKREDAEEWLARDREGPRKKNRS